MPRKCTICTHERSEEIDELILKGDLLRTISNDYEVSVQSLKRHRRNGHIAKELVRASEEEQQGKSVSLYESFEEIRQKVDKVIEAAEQDKNYPTVLQGLRELRELFKLKIQMEALRIEGGVEVDPIALTIEIREFLSERYPKAHKGLLKHLQERSEYYRARISKGK